MNRPIRIFIFRKGADTLKALAYALAGSVIIHTLYFTYTLLAGYIRTMFYKPDISGSWEQAHYLQSEVAFGASVSPYVSILTFLAGTLFCGFIICIYRIAVKKAQ